MSRYLQQGVPFSIKKLLLPDEDSVLLGVVTSGSAWKFFKLSDSNMTIDLLEYPIANPEKIMGILQHQ